MSVSEPIVCTCGANKKHSLVIEMNEPVEDNLMPPPPPPEICDESANEKCESVYSDAVDEVEKSAPKYKEIPIVDKPKHVVVDCVCGKAKISIELNAETPSAVLEKLKKLKDAVPEYLDVLPDSKDDVILVKGDILSEDNNESKIEMEMEKSGDEKEQNEKEEEKSIEENFDTNENENLKIVDRVEPLEEHAEPFYVDDDDENPLNCCHVWGSGWRQFTSVIPGIVLLLASGFYHVYTIYELDASIGRSVLRQRIHMNGGYYYHNERTTDFNFVGHGDSIGNAYRLLSAISFYAGAIVGNLLGAPLNKSLKKRHIYYIAGVLQVISGAVFLFRHSYANIMTLESRIMMGLSYGLVYLTLTIHTSDIASRPMRKKVSLFVVMLNAISTVSYAIYALMFYPKWDIGGIDLMVTGVLAIILVPCVCNEPATLHLLQKKDVKALKVHTKLHSEKKPSRKTLQKFAELELMVGEDVQNGHNVLYGGNFRPFFIVLKGKIAALAVSNAPLMLSLCWIAGEIKESADNHFSLILMIQIACGIVILILSKCGTHRFIYVYSILIASATGFGFLNFTLIRIRVLPETTINWLVIIGFSSVAFALNYYQFLHGMEAFTVTKKAWSNAITSIIEHSLHMCAIMGYILLSDLHINKILYILGMIIVLFISSIFLFVMVPAKMNKLSVRQTRNKYNKKMSGKLLQSLV